MNAYEQQFYSAGWAARKAFKRRDPVGCHTDAQSYQMWLKGYDECELHWKRLL